jgi:Bacterial self-protective colicin-like immunity
LVLSESADEIVRALRKYRVLIAKFASGAMTADAFETKYLALYKAEPTIWPQEVYEILDALFFDVDDYVGDPELRARAGGMDGVELRNRAEQTLRKLDRYS